MVASSPTWSEEQERIFAWFAKLKTDLFTDLGLYVDPNGNLIVRARAGTGKTTTIVEGVNRAPEKLILVCAFNKRIADELVTRVKPGIDVMTLHKVGYRAVRRFWPSVRLKSGREKDNHRMMRLADAVCPTVTRGYPVPDAIKNLVAQLHTKGREITPHATQPGPLANLAVTFELEPDIEYHGCVVCARRRDQHTESDNHAYDGWDLEYVEDRALAAMELAASRPPTDGVIDFSDMLFLPVRNHWLVPTYDLVVVDEAQDMTVTQLEIARGVCRGRTCVVGDDRQAIYAFRGADSDSLDRLKTELKAGELSLTTTYRCGRRIVDVARQLVPDFQCGAEHEGTIEMVWDTKLAATAQPGDFILSRLNAPLVAIAMRLLRNGVRAEVAGKNIGKGLIALVRKLAGRGKKKLAMEDFLARVSAWEGREVARMTAADRQDRVEAIRDQAEMIVSLCEGVDDVEDIVARIEALFSDSAEFGTKGFVNCSSVHRSKGLEANRVFVLKKTLRNTNQEELNIQYVAITRAKQTLVWVEEGE